MAPVYRARLGCSGDDEPHWLRSMSASLADILGCMKKCPLYLESRHSAGAAEIVSYVPCSDIPPTDARKRPKRSCLGLRRCHRGGVAKLSFRACAVGEIRGGGEDHD
jgi:hypothetical protein